MRNTLRQITLPVTLIVFSASTSMALASAGGTYFQEPPKPTAQDQRAASEQASEATWELLREQVPDLEQDDNGAAQSSIVPKSSSVQPQRRMCRRVAVEGTRIKRRVCKTLREIAAEDREGKLHSEALLRYKMFQ
ncbi:MAG: hypothetical protein AAGA68_25380 [Pseudomonadota bacterium]